VVYVGNAITNYITEGIDKRIDNLMMFTIKNTTKKTKIDGLIFTVNNLIVRFPNWDFDKLYFYRCGNI